MSERQVMKSVLHRPRLLDLFCGAGGAGMGYHRAGFDVVGVDIKPQPRYPFEFHQADAMTYPLEGFDAIHASPPCQAYSVSRNSITCRGIEYPDLLPPTRERLIAWGGLYVIENVPGAPINSALLLCGTMFGLRAIDTDGEQLYLRRHRLFESGVLLYPPTVCTCADQVGRCAGVYAGGPMNRNKVKAKGVGGFTPTIPIRMELLGTPWIRGKMLSEAIPPAYTEWIGKQLLDALEVAA